MEHHPTYQPSAFPAWAQCPSWDRKPVPDGDEAVREGILQHELLAKSFTPAKDSTPPTMELDLDDEEQTKDIDPNTLFAVRRAHDNILAKLNEYHSDTEFTLLPEHRCEDTIGRFSPLDNGVPIFGTADLIAVPKTGDTFTVVDYKSHYTNKPYWEQLMFYAVCFAQTSNFKWANLVVCYGDNGTVEEKLIHIDSAISNTRFLLRNRNNPMARRYMRNSGAWCDLCSHCGNCAVAQGIVKRANKIIPSSNEVLWPEDYVNMLAICASAEKRIKAFREHALQYAKENGGVITDGDGNIAYEIQTSQRSELDIDAFYKKTRDILSPNAIIAAAKLPKTKAKELLKATGTLKSKEIEAILKDSSTEPTTIEKLVRCTKGN